jgi:hypothetical protein
MSNTFDFKYYISMGLSEEEAKQKVEQNRLALSVGVKRGKVQKRLMKYGIFDVTPDRFLEMENLYYKKYKIKPTSLLKLISGLNNKFGISTEETNIKLISVLEETSKHYKKPAFNRLFFSLLYGADSLEYSNYEKICKSYASSNVEKYVSLCGGNEIEARKITKEKYGSLKLENIMKKYSCNEEEARSIIKNRLDKIKETNRKKPEHQKATENRSKANNLENFIKRFGPICGPIKFNEYKERKKGNGSKEFYIEKYGEEEGLKKYQEIYAKKSYWSMDYWLKKGFTEAEASKKIEEIFSKRPSFSKEFCIEKYGIKRGLEVWKARQDLWQKSLRNKPQEEIDRINRMKSSSFLVMTEKYGEEEANRRFKEMDERRSLNPKVKLYSSREATGFFIMLYKRLRKLGVINRDECLFAIRGSKEKYLYTKESKRMFFYDFTIESLKCIVEYHGVRFHPKLGDVKWVSAFGEKYEVALEKDNTKRQLALDNGYTYFEIWSDEDKNEALEYLTNSIFEIYEGKN